MAKLQLMILSLLPLCFGQFSIQGPSDGNRRAQGLKYSADKGIEYEDQSASLGAGDFSIQGATDGSSNFQIQGASDANANFQIHGATNGGSQAYIQGATDGGSQSYIQGAYDGNQPDVQPAINQGHRGGGKALQYKDPSGLRVNWRSYNRANAAAAQSQPEPQYVQEQPAKPRQTQRKPTHRRAQAQQAQAQPQPQHRPQQQQQWRPNVNYNPIDKAPPSIQEILQYQAQIPYVNIIPEHLRYDGLAVAQQQAQKFQEDYPKQVVASQPTIEEAPRSQYRQKSRGSARPKRQAAQYQDAEPQPQQAQPHGQPQYRRIAQPAREALPHYSTNIPQSIKDLLKYQSQAPYDIFANHVTYKVDANYAPQQVQHQAQLAPQPQPQPQQEAEPVYAQQQHEPQYQGQYDQLQQLGQLQYDQQQQLSSGDYQSAYAQQTSSADQYLQNSLYAQQPTSVGQYQGQSQAYSQNPILKQSSEYSAAQSPLYSQSQARGYGGDPRGQIRPVKEQQF